MIGKLSSADDRIIPVSPSASEIRSGRIRKPPRSAYIEFRTKIGRLVFKALSQGSSGGAARAHTDDAGLSNQRAKSRLAGAGPLLAAKRLFGARLCALYEMGQGRQSS